MFKMATPRNIGFIFDKAQYEKIVRFFRAVDLEGQSNCL